MAITATASNHFKYQLAKKAVDLSADTIKIILMNTTFSFNKDSHATLADVTADQLATGNGYTQDDKTLANLSLAEDDTGDKAKMTCDDVTWTASGGAIGPTGAAILYDDTTSDDTVIGCIDFGTDYTVPDGSSLTLQDIEIDIA
jgi:hypothetical protein